MKTYLATTFSNATKDIAPRMTAMRVSSMRSVDGKGQLTGDWPVIVRLGGADGPVGQYGQGSSRIPCLRLGALVAVGWSSKRASPAGSSVSAAC